MQDRSINVGGSLYGGATTGNNSPIHNESHPIKEYNVDEILIEVLGDLARRYPNATEPQRENMFQVEIQEICQDPTLKDRLLNAVKSGGIEIVKVLTNNPFVSVSTETIRGWIEAG